MEHQITLHQAEVRRLHIEIFKRKQQGGGMGMPAAQASMAAQPMQPQFGAPPMAAPVIPQNPGFGAPQNTGFGAPQNTGFGAPPPNPPTQAWGAPATPAPQMQQPPAAQNAFAPTPPAPATTSLAPNTRLLNIKGRFLGTVQKQTTQGFAISIKRMGKTKFYDYTTEAACLEEWEAQTNC